MADTVTAEVRSRMMAAVRSRDTKPELALRRALHAAGFRFRVHSRIGKARPDIKLTRYRAAVFVHGCFWHGHDPCRLARRPKSNTGFWNGKIEGNMARDARNLAELRAAGWRVAVVWECAIRGRDIGEVAARLAAWVAGGEGDLEISGAQEAGR